MIDPSHEGGTALDVPPGPRVGAQLARADDGGSSASAVGARLSVAESIARRCHHLGITKAFAYPGTSELALCQAFAAAGDGILVNSRGDREAVFMAGGAGVSGRPHAAAIIHGARGLTNAAGAIGDLRRNEIPTLVIVGLPSTSSARFLPPHGEDRLLEAVGAFAKHQQELRPGSDPVCALDDAVAVATALPCGPVLLGVPQDVLESRVVAADSVARRRPPIVARPPAERQLRQARALLRDATFPVILVDDYLLRHQGAQSAVADLAERLDAPIYQVRYRRGPMLFPQLTGTGRFAGLYDPERPEHRHRMATADLLITIEDRNIYHRVVGRLPRCPKIAITSNPDKTRRNSYLASGDVVIDGDPVTAITRLATETAPRAAPAETGLNHDPSESRAASLATPRTPREQQQVALAEVVRGCLVATGARYVVDDSQMAGGLLAGVYEQAFGDLAVIGDHAGFVGAGIPLATGLAITMRCPVLCLVGDQGFTNGSQGLVCAAQEMAPVLYLVCNNTESVSLRIQADELDQAGPVRDFDRLLRNPPDYSYVAAARAAGVPATSVDLDRLASPATDAVDRTVEAATDLWGDTGPALVELRLPGSGPAWQGVWATRGLDEEPLAGPPPPREAHIPQGSR